MLTEYLSGIERRTEMSPIDNKSKTSSTKTGRVDEADAMQTTTFQKLASYSSSASTESSKSSSALNQNDYSTKDDLEKSSQLKSSFTIESERDVKRQKQKKLCSVEDNNRKDDDAQFVQEYLTRDCWWPPSVLDKEEEDQTAERKPYSEKHMKRMRRAQRKHRTDLDDWQKQKYFETWDKIKSRLLEVASSSKLRQQIPPIIFADEEKQMSLETFRGRFEIPKIPCLINNMAETWKAKHAWSIPNLRARFGDVKFKCGEDDDGYPIKVKLETFCRYMENQKDDSPLYIFDTSFEKTCPDILKEFRVPRFFPEDLFEMVGERRRPPHRWFLIGPERSGTTVHIDPLETSAWNTLIRGRKLWVMFPPSVDRFKVKGRAHKLIDDEAVDYFSHMLDKIMQNDLTPEQVSQTYFFVQYPGQTVFVPHGWWHAVLNMDDTVAVTQNYVGSVNFPFVWRSVRVERKKMARKWRQILNIKRPDLFKIAEKLDKEDGYDLDLEIEKRKLEKKLKKDTKRKNH